MSLISTIYIYLEGKNPNLDSYVVWDQKLHLCHASRAGRCTLITKAGVEIQASKYPKTWGLDPEYPFVHGSTTYSSWSSFHFSQIGLIC